MSRLLLALCMAIAWPMFIGESARAADPTASGYQDGRSPYMRSYGVTSPPYGYLDFCIRMPEECRRDGSTAARVELSPANIADLDFVNRKVNKVIAPATDMELYGVDDYWTVPTDKGDCEDYALLKRQTLIRMGWPAGALLMTVVYDENNQGHAVLTARLTSGDLILDNKTDQIKIWHQTPYSFLMRQSYFDPQVWMSLDPDQAKPSIEVAGQRHARH